MRDELELFSSDDLIANELTKGRPPPWSRKGEKEEAEERNDTSQTE